VRNPIDQFILARLEREKLKPAPEADRRTLARRVSLDLTGLPPTPDEINSFIHDTSPNAWEKVVDRLLWEAPGLAAAMQSGTLVIDMGSSDPLHSRSNAERLAACGLEFIDAPVSGGVKRAIDGTLSIMVGGPKAAFERAQPVLQAMGKTVIHVGGAGAGHAVKALNNYVSAAGLIAVSEALMAAAKFGIDPHLVNQVFNVSTGRNNTTERKVEDFMLSKRYDSGFALELMRKDVQTASQFINGMGTPGRFARECLGVAAEAEDALGAGADHTAVHAYFAAQLPA